MNEYRALVAVGALLSVILFVGTLALIPVVVARIPVGYFSAAAYAHRAATKRSGQNRRTVREIGFWILRNAAGWTCILAGAAMLLLPGQGLLTIAVGVFLASFPGKQRLERWFIQRPVVFKGLNWIRRRAGKPPFER